MDSSKQSAMRRPAPAMREDRIGYLRGMVARLYSQVRNNLADATVTRLWTSFQNALDRALRQRERYAKHNHRHHGYARNGLNGPRAVDRRKRQIARAGGYCGEPLPGVSLREANGLVHRT